AATETEPADRTAQPTIVARAGGVSDAAFGAGGTAILVVLEDGGLRVLSTATLGELAVFPTFKGGLIRAEIADQASRVLTVDGSGMLRAWDVSDHSPRLLGTLPARTAEHGTITAVAFEPRGRTAVIGFSGGRAYGWTVGQTEPVELFAAGAAADGGDAPAHDDRVLAAAFDSTGKRAATTSRDGSARVWAFEPDARTIAETAVLSHAGSVGAVAFRPDGAS